MFGMSLTGVEEAVKAEGSSEALEAESDRLDELLHEATEKLRDIPRKCAESAKKSAERLTLPSCTKVHKILSNC